MSEPALLQQVPSKRAEQQLEAVGGCAAYRSSVCCRFVGLSIELIDKDDS